MAELTILPTWAANHIREHLMDHVHVINAIPAGKGFLVNTSQGAVLLEKPKGREPRHWFLPLPSEHVSLKCNKCDERMEFIGRERGATVYCSHCGAKHTL